MGLLDKDLVSIQETRLLINNAKMAQKELENLNQEEINKIVKVISDVAFNNAEKLAKMAHEETGFGKWEDKVLKNIFASQSVYESIKDIKTVGIVEEDTAKQTLKVMVPVGVVAGLIPSTNPTSTTIYKIMISIKSRNSIVVSPHPSAKKSIIETANLIIEAAEKAGCPKGAIACINTPSMQGTNELMTNKNTSLILATGGEAMVRAAYSSGTPAIGVGPGNGPAFIDKSADIKLAVKRILDSKTFDNGTICASEQSVVVEESIEAEVVRELESQGAYFLSECEAKKLSKFVMRANGTMNPQIVGKSPQDIAKLAGLENVPSTARVLIPRETKVGHSYPFSREKLTTILTFYVEKNIDEVLEKCRSILLNEGAGHTFSMHANDESLVKRFALEMPVSRMVVNSPSALAGIGAVNNIVPALTLGCGAIGGSSTSNNIGPMDLMNVRNIAYGTKELEDIKKVANQNISTVSGIDLSEKEELINLLVQKIVKELR
ncbi:MAG: acetaldehyde dehydrogenase (acetylating) [Clostridium sp.]|uniref:acetaldehyde dehydrogenase (acetylating) n=1 Tax=Clostridium sp. TaxID=1506 RepID=UPI003F39D676